MPEMRRTFKDSVFTCLFSDPKYMRELYLYLHPEDADVAEEEFQLVTTENILSVGQYKEYVAAHEISLYSTKAAAIPLAELYVVYTGTKENVPETLRLSDLCGGCGSVEVAVSVLRGGDGSILGQYVEFCKIADAQRKLYGLTKTAIQETMRICLEKGILTPFLAARRKEVIDIMEMLFSQEEVWEMTKREIARDAKQEGRQEFANLCSELQRRLDPLGRVGELLAAVSDPNKLTALAQEFGLKI